jgi:hypothetical protein
MDSKILLGSSEFCFSRTDQMRPNMIALILVKANWMTLGHLTDYAQVSI